ncbi:6704_t:CDS:2 [Entrophospora sp. SA101]|nr:7440_t:CDS:2 [Entrophospora sp. SA101]CAJ0824563.1 6704_t:CDS:2 [Entrophospora sp. SA101]
MVVKRKATEIDKLVSSIQAKVDKLKRERKSGNRKEPRTYHYQRQRLAKLYDKEPKTYASSHIRFGVGLVVPHVHDFSNFLDTMAHELAHCLLGDFDLDLASEHNDEHKKLTREISEYLGKMPEVKELERLQREFGKPKKI